MWETRETQVRPLVWDDPLEKEKATHSSISAWKIPWIAEPGELQSTESQRVVHDTHTEHTKLRYHDSPALAQGGGWIQEG